ncbi:MAG: dockerin type I repeat-containing protein [Phycisphaerae bacterium]|nr:dockerin type I repeat-containing protein [Phycisphaerae bacterium]
MNRLPILLIATAIGLFLGQTALAEPAWGSNCLACHNQVLDGVLFVVGEDTQADPDESATGATDRGVLQVFSAIRGETKSLQAGLAGLSLGNTYAVELKRFRFPGVEAGGQLTYAADCEWPEWGESAGYYTDPFIRYTWDSGPAVFDYEIGIESDAAFDYYDVVYAVAGKLAGSGELFYAEQHFYVQVMPLYGDTNCDGSVDVFDIDSFVMAITAPSTYAQTYCDGDNTQADVNGDGLVDIFDIDPFVEALTGG